MNEELPKFKYHPDSVATGSVVEDTDTPCLSCNRIRGYVYDGPTYSEKFHHLGHHICPWCIADGSAAAQFGAEFTDVGLLEDISEAAMDEVAHRTPGFEAWQDAQWLTCCGDVAAFLGRAGKAELKGKFAEAREAVESDWEGDWKDLSADDQPTAYIFKCLHCGEFRAYVDES